MTGPASQAEATSAVETAELTAYCRRLCPGGSAGAPGLLVAIARGDGIEYGKAGLADVEHDVPISMCTRFEVGSIAKQITGYVLSRLIGGDDQLDKPLSEFIPEAGSLADIPIRYLADHRSSVRDYESVLALAGLRAWDFRSQQEVLQLILSQRALTPAAPHYSNSHYLLLAEVIRRISGKSLADVAGEILFTPQAMTQSAFRTAPDQLIRDRARSYYSRDAGRTWRLADTADVTVGPHGLYSTAADLARWEGYLLNQTSLDADLRGKATPAGKEVWHLGRTKRSHGGRWLCGHGGSRFGFRCALWTDEAGTTVMVLANRADVDADDIADDLRDRAGQHPATRTRPADQPPPASVSNSRASAQAPELPREGWYWSTQTGAEWQVRIIDDALVMSSGARELTFHPEGGEGWAAPGGRLSAVCVAGGTAQCHDAVVIKDGRSVVVELEFAGPGTAVGNGDDMPAAATFVQPEWGISLAWQSTAAAALMRMGRAAHRLRRVGPDVWIGGGMRVERRAGELVIDMPRAHAIVFIRQEPADQRPTSKARESIAGRPLSHA